MIRVALEGEQCLREFAASLRTPHKLNRPEGQDGTLLDSQGLRPPAELYADVAAPVRQRLLERLRAGDAHDFVEVDEQWLLREMMADVHIGHLNLAEAAIEERNAPISTGDLPKVIELPAEIPPAIRSFSNVPLPCEQRGADEAERQRAVEEQRRKEAEWQARLRAEQEAKPVPAEQQPKVEQQVRSAEIQRICRERRITELVHFTRIQNLRSILEHGLVGRSVLETWPKEKQPRYNDDLRIDGCRDAVCLSVSFPNYRMFYKYRKYRNESGSDNSQEYRNRNESGSDNSQGWVVLLLSPAVLWELDCAFCHENASSNAVKRYSLDERRQVAFFKRMFEDHEPNQRQNLRIPDNFTTNPQAEVLVFESIPKHYITTVCFSDPKTLAQWQKANPVPWTQKFVVNQQLFGPRVDWQWWKQSTSTEDEMPADDAFWF